MSSLEPSSALVSQRICIVGLGMIGGSIARGLRQALPELTITAVDQDAEALSAAAGSVISALAVDSVAAVLVSD